MKRSHSMPPSIPIHGLRRIDDLAYSPDGLRLAGAAGRTVIVWDATTGETLLSLQGGLDPITSVTFSPDGSRILAGGNDWRIRVWDSVPYRGRYEERQALLGSRGAGQGEAKR